VEPDSLEISIGPLRAKNPIFSASGTFGYGEEMESFVDPGIYGGVIGKSISLHPRAGNPLPRVAETAAGMLNSIGLQNPGIDAFLREVLPRMRRYRTILVVNLVGDSIEEYEALAERLEGEAGADAIELNISCPNCAAGGMRFGIDPRATEVLVRRVREKYRRPIIAKLTPNVTDIAAIARAAEDGGADGISLINTILAMAVDARTRRPKLANVMGGLSGPAIKPIALRMVYQAARAVRIPVIGLGGIMTGEDAVEFLIAGARAVQVGTASFIDPAAGVRIAAEIGAFCDQHGVARVADLVGTLRVS